jgi:hypothetical protein
MADWGKLSPGVWVTTSAAVTNTFRGVTRIRLPESAEVLRQQNLDGVIGMDREHGKGPLSEWRTGETAFINETLARQLKVTRGDEFVLRVQKPSALAHDAVITPRNEGAVAIHLKVGAILTPDMLEDFSLTAGQALPANVFVPLEFLNEKLGVSNRANLLFEGAVMQKPESGRWDGRRARLAQWLLSLPPRSWGGPPPDSIRGKLARAVTPRTSVPARSDVGVSWLNKHLEPAWVPEDAGIIVRTVEPPQSATGGEYIRPCAEVASSRIFIEPSIAKAALTQRTKLLTNRFAYPADSPNDIAFARLVTGCRSAITLWIPAADWSSVRTHFACDRSCRCEESTPTAR